MTEPTLNALTQRLDRLEREVRWWKLVGSAAVGLLGVIFLLGAAGGKVTGELRAKRFLVVDEGGGARAILGSSGLGLYDQAQKLRFQATVETTTTNLGLYDGNGKLQASLAVHPDGSSGLVLGHDGGRLSAVLGSFPLGKEVMVGLGLLDQSKKERVLLYFSPNRGARLDLADTDENLRFTVGVAPDDTVGMAFPDKDKKVRIGLATDADGTPGLVLADKDRRARTEFRLSHDGSPVLALQDKDGKVIWKAP